MVLIGSVDPTRKGADLDYGDILYNTELEITKNQHAVITPM